MATNYYLPFGVGTGANVWSDATYNGSSQQQTGIQTGIVPSGLMTKAWRQSSVPASALGQIITDHGLIDAPDDGNMLGFKANLRMSIAAMLAGVAFGVDQSSVANVLTVILDPAPPSLTSYRSVFVRAANTNTGPVTLALNALGTRGVVKRNGAALAAGDIVAGQFVHLLYDLTLGQWTLSGTALSDIVALINATAPQIVSANPVVYVSTTGNDTTGTGSMAAPFATIQAALNYGVSRYQFAGFTLTVQLVAAGTYAVPTNIPRGCGNLAISGNTAGPANYILSGAGSTSTGGVLVVSGVSMNLTGVTLLNSSNITNTLTVSNGGSCNLSYVRLQLATQLSGSHVYSGPGGSIVVGQGCSIVNGGSTYALAAIGGSIVLGGYQITVGANSNFSGAFAFAQSCGTISVSYGGSFSASGATGTTYLASLNGVINTFGAGANFFPGSNAGSTSSGGQYA